MRHSPSNYHWGLLLLNFLFDVVIFEIWLNMCIIYHSSICVEGSCISQCISLGDKNHTVMAVKHRQHLKKQRHQCIHKGFHGRDLMVVVGFLGSLALFWRLFFLKFHQSLWPASSEDWSSTLCSGVWELSIYNCWIHFCSFHEMGNYGDQWWSVCSCYRCIVVIRRRYSGALHSERLAMRWNRITKGPRPSLEHSLSDGPYGLFSLCDDRADAIKA